MELGDQLLDTWAIHNRINLYLLEAIAPDALDDVSASKGRSVAAQFSHLHNVRLMWLSAAAPELAAGLARMETNPAPEKEALRAALVASGDAIAKLLTKGLAAGKIKGFKPHPTAFLGYLIAHESYHRGEIGIILAQAGHKLDEKVSYGIWEWGVR